MDAFYEAVKLRHIVTQIIMRSYKLKTNFKSLIPDRLRNEYPELAKLFEKIDRYQETTEETKLLSKYDELKFEEVRQQYMSWRGYIEKLDSYKTLQDMDKLFNDLFILDWKQVERKKKRRKSYDVKYGEK